MAHVLDDGQTSNKFPVGNGVKQGCVLAPTVAACLYVCSWPPEQVFSYPAAVAINVDRAANLELLRTYGF
jgi:hypothetical protein